jgi:hypothetical protein
MGSLSVGNPLPKSEDHDLMPVEVEFSRAIDRLQNESQHVEDWSMVLQDMFRVVQMMPAAKLAKRGTEKVKA